jgi:antitoxin HigA-1
LHIFTIH